MTDTPHPVDAMRLADARLQAHWALQPVAAAGAALLEPLPDWSHTSTSFDPSSGALMSRSGAGLRLADLTLVWSEGKRHAEIALDGRTLEEALALLSIEARRSDSQADLELLDHELPDHPVADGAGFDRSDVEAFRVLASWFGMAHRILDDLRAATPGASTVRCWPHHFDIATLIDVAGDGSRTIGVGLSPGDAGNAEPYWYVSPWPHPDEPGKLPAFDPPGNWHTEGWVGAALGASEMHAATGPGYEIARGFVERAVHASRIVLSSS